METLLLVIVIVLLWVDLDEEDVSRGCGAAEDQTRVRHTRRADFQLKQLTDQAVLTMLDEARRYEPGQRP